MSAMSQDRLPEPTCNPRHTLDPFHRLVEDLSLALGPSSGIDSADVAPDVLERLMESYMSDPKDWGKYAFGDLSRTYTRNLVDTGNGKSNLLILVWTPGRGSPIHDHADAHCVMKVLKGSLKETLYTWPNRNQVNDGLASPLKIQKETVYGRDQVTYMSDNLGLHKISNPDPNEFAVSLHLYTPPNAAKVGCHMYEEATGSSSHVKQCYFYSELGHKL